MTDPNEAGPTGHGGRDAGVVSTYMPMPEDDEAWAASPTFISRPSSPEPVTQPASTDPGPVGCGCEDVARTHHVGLPKDLAAQLRSARRDAAVETGFLAQQIGVKGRTLTQVFDGVRRPSAHVARELGRILHLDDATRTTLMMHTTGRDE